MVASLATAFPWRSLDSIGRDDIALLAKLRRAVTRIADPASSEAALRDLLGACDLSIQLRRITSSPPRIDDAGVGILVAPGERANQRHAFAIILEQALAVALAGRGLRRPAPKVTDGTSRGSLSLAGGVGAILIAAARRRAVGPLRVLDAGGAHAILGAVVSNDPTPIGATFTVLLDHDAYLAHVFAPRSAIAPLPDPEMDARSLAALGAIPLEVPLIGGSFAMTAGELASLSPGDALVPIDTKHLELVGFGSDLAFRVDVAADGRLVLLDGPQALSEEETVDKNALAQSLGETPIVVRVEVGSAQMTAREWSLVGSGDVIALGKRIGENVVLRVAGVEVARGELVDVEGEVGVRIVARSGGTVA